MKERTKANERHVESHLEETSESLIIRNEEKNVTQLYKILKDEYDVFESKRDKAFVTKKKNQNKKRDKSNDRDKDNKKICFNCRNLNHQKNDC